MRYEVKLPVAGYAMVSVEADTPEKAVEKAFEECTLDNIEEWEAFRKIIRGNVFYGNCNDVSVFDEDNKEVDFDE